MTQIDELKIIEYFPRKISEISGLLSDISQKEKLNKEKLNKETRKQYKREADDLRQQLLKQVDYYSLTYNYMEATNIADKNAFRTKWQQNLPPLPNQEWFDFVQVSSPDLCLLPLGSFFIQFTFKLLKPYISRDDNQFYIVDNPIVRDQVFHLPMVRSTAWKGSLRHALWLEHDTDNEQIQRLFGTADDNSDNDTSQRGRLYFYPTFFTKTSLEIINPHDREKRVGQNPILLECVPADVSSTFTLLYVPFDQIGKDVRETRQQVADDLQFVVKGLRAMMTTYGFGAKTSSGFGLAKDSLRDGYLQMVGLDAPDEVPQAAVVVESALPRYLSAPGQLHPGFQTPDGDLINEADYRQKIESQGKKYTKKQKQLYVKAKGWWESTGQALAEQAAVEPEQSELQEPPYPPVTIRAFSNWGELQAKTDELARPLKQRETDG